MLRMRPPGAQGKHSDFKKKKKKELCLQDVEWIVEDFGSEDGTVPFADFGVVEFTDATAVTISGEEVGPEDATPVDIEQGNVLTSVSIGSSSVTVTYV